MKEGTAENIWEKKNGERGTETKVAMTWIRGKHIDSLVGSNRLSNSLKIKFNFKMIL